MFPVLIAGEYWEDKLKICISNLKSFTGLWVHKWVKTETHHLLQKTQSPAVLRCPLLLIPTTHPQEHTWPLSSHQLYFKKVSKELKVLCGRPDNSPSKMLAFYSLVPVNMSLSNGKGTLQIQLRLKTWDGEIILHYAGRPSGITWVLKSGKGKQRNCQFCRWRKEVMSQGMRVASSSWGQLSANSQVNGDIHPKTRRINSVNNLSEQGDDSSWECSKRDSASMTPWL